MLDTKFSTCPSATPIYVVPCHSAVTVHKIFKHPGFVSKTNRGRFCKCSLWAHNFYTVFINVIFLQSCFVNTGMTIVWLWLLLEKPAPASSCSVNLWILKNTDIACVCCLGVGFYRINLGLGSLYSELEPEGQPLVSMDPNSWPHPTVLSSNLMLEVSDLCFNFIRHLI